MSDGIRLADATIALTGATGFLGGYTVRSLLARGARVVGVVRNPDKVPALRATPGVELRTADLRDLASLEAGFRGCHAVVSNAALVSLGDKARQALIDSNVQGVTNVMNAVAAAGVARCIHVSSATVYRPKRGHWYEEGDPLRDGRGSANRFTDYATSKALGERAAWRLADEHGVSLSTARPHTVYGAHDHTGFTKWFKRVMRPSLFSAFPLALDFPAIYAGDLADALCAMLERGDVAGGKAYNVTAPPEEAQDLYAHIDAYRRAGGRVPRWVLPVPLPLRRRYSTARARADLGLRARPLVDGYRDMLRLEAGG